MVCSCFTVLMVVVASLAFSGFTVILMWWMAVWALLLTQYIRPRSIHGRLWSQRSIILFFSANLHSSLVQKRYVAVIRRVCRHLRSWLLFLASATFKFIGVLWFLLSWFIGLFDFLKFQSRWTSNSVKARIHEIRALMIYISIGIVLFLAHNRHWFIMLSSLWIIVWRLILLLLRNRILSFECLT